MIKEKRLSVEVILSCLPIELGAAALLLFHLFLISQAFFTLQGA